MTELAKAAQALDRKVGRADSRLQILKAVTGVVLITLLSFCLFFAVRAASSARTAASAATSAANRAGTVVSYHPAAVRRQVRILRNVKQAQSAATSELTQLANLLLPGQHVTLTVPTATPSATPKNPSQPVHTVTHKKVKVVIHRHGGGSPKPTPSPTSCLLLGAVLCKDGTLVK